ncbi:anion permease [Candidatus Aerophobetes bacterium]|uniref:Phosphate transporter n=1 Tax=Aerophobetes bacterium TaxID=2030807 RepID=A0A2A4X2D6_UNCAE|nr:MAG: anion permease [Candidatus Aerophobetes bacterium]
MNTILLITVLIAGFYMAWNIGANDVSNAMGTSVGSGALTLTKAVIIAGVLEFCGAFFLGGNVSKTIQGGLVDTSLFAHCPHILLYGMLSALISTALWLQLSSYFGWPVSTTHAIVGSLLGFGLFHGGTEAVFWGEVGMIASSWVISPVLSGLISFFIFTLLQKKVLYTLNPIQATKKVIPYLCALLFFVFTLTFLLAGVGRFSLHISEGYVFLIAGSVAIVTYFLARIGFKWTKMPASSSAHFSAKDAQRLHSFNKTQKHLQRIFLTSKHEEKEQIHTILKQITGWKKELEEKVNHFQTHSDYQIVEKRFVILQIFSASYIAFAHGANDVANAIGPVAASLNIIKTGTVQIAPHISSSLLALGGAGIVIGLATWGWRVMETIGKKITVLTPTRGFSAEFGAAITILIASKLGLPISTTHCIVGSVLGVGLARGLSSLNLKTLKDIFLSWIITIPASAILCVIIFYLIRALFSSM